ncbi:unnamed protein product [Brassica oleracea var. botrytis]
MTTWIAGDLWLMAVTGGGEVSHLSDTNLEQVELNELSHIEVVMDRARKEEIRPKLMMNQSCLSQSKRKQRSILLV